MSPGSASSPTSRGEPRRIAQREHVPVAMSRESGNQRALIDAVDRRLARGVDIGDDHRVGIVEAGAEPIKQIGEPGVAVRLHDGDDLAGGDRPRRLQNRGDLDRVVAVFVDDGDSVPFAGLGGNGGARP